MFCIASDRRRASTCRSTPSFARGLSARSPAFANWPRSTRRPSRAAELRHRCFVCSLAPVCLPEETLYLTSPSAPSADVDISEPSAALTRVVPVNDDRAVLYVQEPGSRVGRRGEHLLIQHRDGQPDERVPLASVRQVVIIGNAQVSTQALESLAAAGVAVAYLTGHGRFVAALQPAPAKNAALRMAQYRVASDPVMALPMARAMIRAKVANRRTLLMRSRRGCDGPARGRDEPAALAMADLPAYAGFTVR